MKYLFILLFCYIGQSQMVVGDRFTRFESERKHEIIIQSSEVPSTVANFPVLITLDNLDTEVVDAGTNSAQLNGDDIIFTSDAAGTTRLAIDVVEFIPHVTGGSRRCEIWVKVPSISSSSNTSVWIWYKNATRTQPAVDATYGRDAVWTGADVVYHLNEDPSGSSPQSTDYTGNGNDGTSNGTMLTGDLITGQIGSALDFDGTDDYINVPYDAGFDKTSDFTVSFWWKSTDGWDTDSTPDAHIVSKSNNTSVKSDWSFMTLGSGGTGGDDNGRVRFASYGGNQQTATASWTADTWYHVALRYIGSTEAYFYVNGVLDTYNSDTNPGAINGTENNPLTIARGYHNESSLGYLYGGVDEVKLQSTAVTADWILTEYNNQSDAGAFAIEQTPTSDTF